MPTVYRSMWEDNGKPRVGTANNCLGARVPPSVPADVIPDANGIVAPGRGMSVNRHWSLLPPLLIPTHVHRRGRGPVGLRCFRMGENEFVDGDVSVGLELRVGKKNKHGEIGPTEPVNVAVYQTNLSATRDLWVIDEQ